MPVLAIPDVVRLLIVGVRLKRIRNLERCRHTDPYLPNPSALRTERVNEPLARYALRRTCRLANAVGPLDAALRLFEIRAARYSWLVNERFGTAHSPLSSTAVTAKPSPGRRCGPRLTRRPPDSSGPEASCGALGRLRVSVGPPEYSETDMDRCAIVSCDPIIQSRDRQ